MGAMTAGTDAGAALRAVTDAVLGLAGEPALEPVLERLVHAVRDLVGARYAALRTQAARYAARLGLTP